MANALFIDHMQIDKRTAQYILSIFKSGSVEDVFLVQLCHTKTRQFVKGFVDGKHINIPSANSLGWYVEDFSNSLSPQVVLQRSILDLTYLGRHWDEIRSTLEQLMAMKLIKGGG
jgi:hypothetical protein